MKAQKYFRRKELTLAISMLLAASVDGKAKLVGFDEDVPSGSEVR